LTSDPIPPAKPFFTLSDIEQMKNDTQRILESGRLTLGEYTERFERQFASLIGVRHAIAVNSGTSALEIALRATKLPKDGRVIIPTNTFSATCAAIIFAGGIPAITDVGPGHMTIQADAVKEAVHAKSHGVIAVHIGGLVCPEIEEIREICEKKDLVLVEDAAHAHGSKIDGKFAGSLGQVAAFSFYPTKVMTSGEGGMITTDDDEIAQTARILRDQGKENFNSNRIVMVGYNWRMPEFCAALGLIQLNHLQEFIDRRNAIAKLYDVALDDANLDRVMTPPNQRNNYYKYTFYLPTSVDRDRFKASCRSAGVNYGGEVYWPPLHLQPAFREFVDSHGHFATAESWGRRMVNPPIFSQMTTEQANRAMITSLDALSKLK